MNCYSNQKYRLMSVSNEAQNELKGDEGLQKNLQDKCSTSLQLRSSLQQDKKVLKWY